MSGDALEVYRRLGKDDSDSYDKLKKALLKRYELTEEGFRNKFRDTKIMKGETATQFMDRLKNYYERWVDFGEIEKSYDALLDLMLREQFVSNCNKSLAVFLKERTPKNSKEMASLAEQYVEAHGESSCFIGDHGPSKFKTNKTDKQGNSNNPKIDSKPMVKGNYSDKTCYKCGRKGHIQRNCRVKEKLAIAVGQNSDPENETHETGATCMMQLLSGSIENNHLKLATGEALPIISGACGHKKFSRKTNLPVFKGKVGDTMVDTLRDSGCTGVVVQSSLIKPEQLTGKVHLCILIDGTVKKVPMANIQVDTPFFVGEVEAMSMESPIYPLVLGNIPGIRSPSDPNPEWNSLKEKETVAVLTRAQSEKLKKPITPLKVPGEIELSLTAEQFKQEQLNDSSLKLLWEMSKDSKLIKLKSGNRSRYLEQKGILYREVKTSDGKKVDKQLVVPKQLRVKVMKLAHETLLGGHLGMKKTTDRIMSSFYWQGLQGDVNRYCRSCDLCQRTTPKGRVPHVPLGRMPLIDTPFQRVAIDLVGPISPVTDRGNRYILTMVDYATRYPEAIALPSIETERVAEALLEIFSRVGIPSEVLSDRGTKFLSNLMQEVNRLLSIKHLVTTPYHPQCNGLVEKFHWVLKSMLRKLCSEKPKDWDRYLSAVLFAYREVPQASTGFAPFELLYGRKVRGPMDILKELWVGEIDSDETKTTYQYIVDLKERLEETCRLAQSELEKAQCKGKYYHDKRSKDRKFQVKDKVLVLLPTDTNKLLVKWQGPFEIVDVLGNDYRAEVKGKIKTYHANLLKKYVEDFTIESDGTVNEQEDSSVLEKVSTAIVEPEPEIGTLDDEKLLGFSSIEQTETYKDVVISPKLSDNQREQVLALLEEFKDILSDLPGHTDLVEHDIELITDKPVRTKPYTIPYHMQNVVDNEIENMLKMKVIRPCNSPYASPIVLVKKKDGSIRFCTDYRKLNLISKFSTEPMMQAG